jgi:uncharacterized protein
MTTQVKHLIPSWALLIIVLAYLVFGFVILILATSNADTAVIGSSMSVNFMRWAQLINSIVVFVLPVAILALVFRSDKLRFFNLHNSINAKQTVNVVILFVIAIPIVGLSSYLNKAILDLPALNAFKIYNNVIEQSLETMAKTFFSDKSISGLISNIIVVAIGAAVTEEIFFRGTLQRLFHENIKSIHLSVWITAILFSAFHMQFSGFIPRMILGALLGYIYIFTGNLWLPIIGHFVNNALGVIGNHFNITQLSDTESMKPNATLYLVATVCIGITVFLLVKIRNSEPLKFYSSLLQKTKDS